MSAVAHSSLKAFEPLFVVQLLAAGGVADAGAALRDGLPPLMTGAATLAVAIQQEHGIVGGASGPYGILAAMHHPHLTLPPEVAVVCNHSLTNDPIVPSWAASPSHSKPAAHHLLGLWVQLPVIQLYRRRRTEWPRPDGDKEPPASTSHQRMTQPRRAAAVAAVQRFADKLAGHDPELSSRSNVPGVDTLLRCPNLVLRVLVLAL